MIDYDKLVIEERVLDKIAAALEKEFSATVQSKSNRIMHLKVDEDSACYFNIYALVQDKMCTLVRVPDRNLLDAMLHRYCVLLEYPERTNRERFVVSGPDWVLNKLRMKFGGAGADTETTYSYMDGDEVCWLLYNDPQSETPYGYTGDNLPTTEQVVGFLKQLCKE